MDDADVFAGFSYARPPVFQAVLPNNRPPTNVINPSNLHASGSSSASAPLPFVPGRIPFFPANNLHRHQDNPVPFDVSGKQSLRSDDAFTGDSGRKSLIMGGEKSVAVARIEDANGRDTEDQSMESADGETVGNPIREPSVVQPVKNLFHRVLHKASHQPTAPVPAQEITAGRTSAERVSTEDTEMTSGQESNKDVAHLQAAFPLDTETSSQTLSFPTQSFVDETYQAQNGVTNTHHTSHTTANPSTSMDIDMDGDQQNAQPPDVQVEDQVPATEPEQAPEKEMNPPVLQENQLDRVPFDESSVANQPGESPAANKSAAKVPVASSVPDRDGESVPVREPSTNGAQGTGATVQREAHVIQPKPIRRSASSRSMVPDRIDVAHQVGTAITKNLPSRLAHDRDSEQGPATVDQPAKKIVHRSTSSSRSGRVLPPKRVERTQSLTEPDGMITSHALRLTKEPSASNGPESETIRGEMATLQGKSSRGPAVADKRASRARNGEDVQPRATSHSTSNDPNATNTGKTTLQQLPKIQLAGNARFHQKIQQSTNPSRMSAQQLSEARAAALPQMDAQVLTNAINRPFVTPSRQEKEAHLTNLISRSSSPSFARAHHGHPRAIQVQERRAQTGLSALAPALNPSHELQLAGSGSQDEKIAISLVFRAKEREAEITNLKVAVKSLEGRNAFLENVNADLLAKNGDVLSQKEKILSEKKVAISKAKELVIKSQQIADACQRDLGKLRKSCSGALESLALTKNDVEETRSKVLSTFAPIRHDVEILNENAKKRNESDEPVVLAQLRMQYETMGQLTVKLQGELEEEKTARATQEWSLGKALENVRRLTENNLCLIEENAKLRVAPTRIVRERPLAEEYEDVSLTSVEEKLDLDRDVLYLKVEQLEADNTALLDQQHVLEVSLTSATTQRDALAVQLREQRSGHLRLEEKYAADLDASNNVCSNLRQINDELQREIESLMTTRKEASQKYKDLEVRLNESAEELSIMRDDCEKNIQEQQKLSDSRARELEGRLQSSHEELDSVKNALVKSEANAQQVGREKDAAVIHVQQLNDLLEKLRIEYEKSLAERDISLKTGVELTEHLKARGDDLLKLEREKAELETRLVKANESKLSIEAELVTVKEAQDALSADFVELEEKYSALTDELDELEKRAEDGKAAHQEDVTKERARYEDLRSLQDSLKERYQTGDLTTLERDLLKLHVEKIQANHDEAIKKLKAELTAAQTDVSLWKKTAGRAVNEKSQKLGGRSLIGSDFDEPSSSPHEALRSAVARRDPELVIHRRDAGAMSGHTPSSPLTAVNTSSEKQDQHHQESQSLSSFLTGGVSVQKRVSFQELAGNVSDEMDNDVPDTLGKIAEEDDEREEDIEESESLMEAVNQKTLQVASSIRDYTQPASRPTNVQDRTTRMEAPVSAAGKNANGKGSTASLGMTRSTRSSSQIMTYSGASRKRGASVLAGNDMESFTSTQEDAIYGKRGGLKKQRK